VTNNVTTTSCAICFPASTNAQRRFLDARLTVDSVVIPISTIEYDDDDNEIGAKLTVTLARLSDKSAFTRDASIKFELGEKLAGVWTWRTMFDGARLKALTHDLAQNGAIPNDRITIIATPLLESRLETTPLGTVALYDPAKLTLLEADFLSVPDIDGVDHPSNSRACCQPLDVENIRLRRRCVRVCGCGNKYSRFPDKTDRLRAR
jgi:hypothetical protein